MSEATPGVPGWHADPSGRHQYRWWDGAGFTDQVADGGVVATDTGPAMPPHEPQPAPPSAPAEPLVAQPKSKLPIVLAMVGFVAVLAAVAAWFLLSGDDGTSGTGTFDETIDSDTPLGVHSVDLVAGDALTVEVEPDSDLDAVVGFVMTEDDADRVAEVYDDIGDVDVRDLDEAFGAVDGDELDALGDDLRVVFRTDVGFAGDDEQLLLAVPFDVEVRVVVAPFEEGDEGEGDYDITIESFPLEVDEDADGEQLLEAVRDDSEIPDAFRELADEALAEAE